MTDQDARFLVNFLNRPSSKKNVFFLHSIFQKALLFFTSHLRGPSNQPYRCRSRCFTQSQRSINQSSAVLYFRTRARRLKRNQNVCEQTKFSAKLSFRYQRSNLQVDDAVIPQATKIEFSLRQGQYERQYEGGCIFFYLLAVLQYLVVSQFIQAQLNFLMLSNSELCQLCHWEALFI